MIKSPAVFSTKKHKGGKVLEADVGNPANYYCAGLFEGEGTVGCYVVNKPSGIKINFQLKISMTDRQPLDLFEDIMQAGKVYGPYRNKNNKLSTKSFYMYIVSTPEEIKYVMDSIWELLSDRRKQQFEESFKTYESWR